MKEYLSLNTKIKEATIKLKNLGYVVITDDDIKFAILAEKKRIICNSANDFLKKATVLEKEKTSI